MFCGELEIFWNETVLTKIVTRLYDSSIEDSHKSLSENVLPWARSKQGTSTVQITTM
jgi:hypothetical protein